MVSLFNNKVRLYCGDCFDVIKHINVSSIDMVLTDPPYVLDLRSGAGIYKERDVVKQLECLNIANGFDINKLLPQLIPLFKTEQHFIGVFFCSAKQLDEYINFAKEKGYQFNVGVWHKTNPPPITNNKYLSDVEFWIYIKGKKAKIMGEFKDKSLVYTSAINKKDKKLYGHPTIKPIPLLEKFLKVHTEEGSTVLDPFMGSGSTGCACLNLDRNFIGIELNQHYFNVAKHRIETHI